MASENFGAVVPRKKRGLPRARLRDTRHAHVRIGFEKNPVRLKRCFSPKHGKKPAGVAGERIGIRIVAPNADTIDKDI